jgi:hypothetical protein
LALLVVKSMELLGTSPALFPRHPGEQAACWFTVGGQSVKFGILYNTDYYPQAHGSASQYYGQILEQTQFAEELGFESVWFGEHHYSGYSFGSPPVIAMAAAARTRRIRLGPGCR